jgi:hypothetical protein
MLLLIPHILFIIIAFASICWLFLKPGWEPFIASLMALVTVAGIGLRAQIHQLKAINEHLQRKLYALGQIRAVVDNIPQGLEREEVLERLKTDPNLRTRLTGRLVRLFGLRNEFIPYLEPEFVELIDTQFQPFYVIQTGTYTFREEKLEEFVVFMEQLPPLVLSMEKRLMQEYKKSLK